jgi:hypothetical protein
MRSVILGVNEQKAGFSGRTDAQARCPARVSTRPSLRSRSAVAAIDPVHLADAAQAIVSHMPPLADVTVALPCSMMKCGDVLHRRHSAEHDVLAHTHLPDAPSTADDE